MNRKEIAHAFRMAKNQLMTAASELGKNKYICHALEDVAIYPRAAQRVIDDRLQGCQTLEGWIMKNGHATEADVYSGAGQQKMQTTRHAWLDALIEEFEK